MHLWEIDHPYYCQDSCYFSAKSILAEYASWADFLGAEGKDDFDLNLLFRWDWKLGDDHELPIHADPSYRDGELDLFFMIQRKGYHRVARVKVCRDEEAAVRKWLKVRFDYLKEVWAPIV